MAILEDYQVSPVIAVDDHLEGTFTSRGTVVVKGSVKGRIEAVQIRVEDGATASLWNMRTGTRVRTLEGEALYLSLLEFSPDGATIRDSNGPQLAAQAAAAHGQSERRSQQGRLDVAVAVAVVPGQFVGIGQVRRRQPQPGREEHDRAGNHPPPELPLGAPHLPPHVRHRFQLKAPRLPARHPQARHLMGGCQAVPHLRHLAAAQTERARRKRHVDHGCRCWIRPGY